MASFIIARPRETGGSAQ